MPARKGNAGQWLVQLPNELQANPDAAGGSSTGSANGDAIAELLAEVAELRDQLGHATGQLAGQERLILQLQEDLTQARQDVEEARRPWWRQWRG
jgi:hypothetical protein